MIYYIWLLILVFGVLTKNAEFGPFFSVGTKWTARKNMALENIKTRTDIFGERRRMAARSEGQSDFDNLDLPVFYWGKYWFRFLKPIVHKSFWWNVSTDDVILKNIRILRHTWFIIGISRARVSLVKAPWTAKIQPREDFLKLVSF